MILNQINLSSNQMIATIKNFSSIFILAIAFFGVGQVNAATLTVSFEGTINLSPLGGDSGTLLNGSFDLDREGGLTKLQIYTGDDYISAENGKALLKEDINSDFLEEALLFGASRKDLTGSIMDEEIQAVWGLFGLSTNAISDQLIQFGEVSPSMLKFSTLVFAYRDNSAFFAYKPLFASIESISIVPTPVPLPTSLIFMISGFMLVLSFFRRKNRMEPDESQKLPILV